MRKIYLGLVCAFAFASAQGQTQTRLAAWSFETLAAQPNTPITFKAEFGTQQGVASLFADGAEGSSEWNQNTELNSFSGSTTGDPKDAPLNSSAYSLIGGTDMSANGKSITLKFSTLGYENPIITFATRGTSSGFDTHQWSYSTDGTNFTNFGENTANKTSSFLLKTLDLTSIDEVDNQTTVWLKLTVSGATTSTGNNRLDNIDIKASLPSGSPNIIVSETKISGLKTASNQASGSTTFEVSGDNLTNDVIVTSSEGFEVSLDDQDYNSEVTIAVAQGDVDHEPIIVYTRITSDAISGQISGTITITSTGASEQIINISGFVASSTATALPHEQSFDTEPSDWFIYNAASNLTWTYNSNGKYFIANAFSDDGPAEDWLISPLLDASNASSLHISFEGRIRFTDAGNSTPLKIYATSNYDGYGNPNSVQWTEISTATFLGNGSDQSSTAPYVYSEYLDVSQFNGDIYIAFVYTSSNKGSGASSEVIIREFSAGDHTLWNGQEWSNEAPNASINATIQGDYSGDLTSRNLYIASGTVSISSSETIEVEANMLNKGSVEIASGGTLAIFGAISNLSSGSFNISRNTTGNLGYSFIGSPISDGDAASVTANYFYQYTESTGEFTEPLGIMTPGKGYLVAYNMASPVVSFTGTPNTGTIGLDVSKSADGFNLIANPYTAAISIGSFLTANSSVVNGSVYFWDDGGSNVGQYRGGDYIAANGAGATSSQVVQPGGSDDQVDGTKGVNPADNGFIPSMQGVFIEATAGGAVSFTTDMISATSGSNADANYYRQNAEVNQRIRVGISGNGLYNEVLLAFRDDATLGVDFSLDAKKYSGNNLISFYSLIGEEKFAIQSLPTLDLSSEVVIPFGFNLAEAGEYEFVLNGLEGISAEYSILVVDQTTGLTHNLSENGSFKFNTSSVSGDQRFKLVLQAASILSTDLKVGNELLVSKTNNGLLLTAKVKNAQEVAIYTVDGKVLFHDVVSFQNGQANIKANLAENRIYVLKANNQSIKFILK